MLIKKNNITEKMKTDTALSSKLTIDEVQDALIELASMISDQDDALVELARIIAEE
mgnify:CR=1 FL=1|nr:MAG TPA: hypothetical protein [Caudoviricetes sp.]